MGCLFAGIELVVTRENFTADLVETVQWNKIYDCRIMCYLSYWAKKHSERFLCFLLASSGDQQKYFFLQRLWNFCQPQAKSRLRSKVLYEQVHWMCKKQPKEIMKSEKRCLACLVSIDKYEGNFCKLCANLKRQTKVSTVFCSICNLGRKTKGSQYQFYSTFLCKKCEKETKWKLKLV